MLRSGRRPRLEARGVWPSFETAAEFIMGRASRGPVGSLLRMRRELLRRLRLRRLVRPVVGLRLGALQLFFGLEAGRHRGIGPGEHLMMLDVQGAQPALLAHRERYEIADLDQLRLAEMLV